jgi:hypothetical protein
MASRLVLMPVFPITTVSEALSFLGKLSSANARSLNDFEVSQVAPSP